MNATTCDAVEPLVIRQSMRCFWFGAAGLAPGVGALVAWQGIGLFRRIMAASGERVRGDFPAALLIIGLAMNPLLQTGLGWPAAAVNAVFLCGVNCAWFAARAAATPKALWNPARQWAWAGAALGGTGLGVTALMVEGGYALAYRLYLLGVG